MYQELPKFMLSKFEVQADIKMVVKIQQLVRSFIVPWETENPDRSFFEEMFCSYFQNTDDNFLTQPIDEALPGFQKSLK